MAANKWTLGIVLAVVALLIPASAHAANNCPWLTEATVGGLLGGNAAGAYTAGPAVTTSTSATINPEAGPTVRMDQPGTCVFTDKEGAATRELTVTMEVSPDAHTKLAGMMQACGASSQLLQAIGNEAAVCTMDVHKKSVSERVVGRVRNQIFTITISTTLKDDPVLNTSSLMTRIYTASEQVAGNLF
ncbi:hypothetical protein [Terracidiphilus gabretensis]|jgi:hypothetical protein|uniref:hypothetical protein n=1 Tax=Terracidiphilus gabretensis TaxID=1577687 RepID=UPI00071BA80A|nr:hypothetical protein [Terracidiphilus gabretensis]